MADIICGSHPVLRQISLAIEPDEDVSAIVGKMIEAMYDADGVGLAAVQLDILKRIVVTEGSGRTAPPVVYINPVISYRSAATVSSEEGCLSFPGVYADVIRSKDIIVQYYDIDFNHRVRHLDGIEARILQHEIDHLDGVLLIDHLSKFKRTRALRKMQARPA